MSKPDRLVEVLGRELEGLRHEVSLVRGEVTIEVSASDYLEVVRALRDRDALAFSQLIDLCGIDYSGYGGVPRQGPRFAVVSHLLSLEHNWRIRVKLAVSNEAMPVLPSLCGIWTAANWYEREAFDMYGLLFEGHPDLRRILTDYDFSGHPLRKDFPVPGFLEMHYDEELGRVAYRPVSFEIREITPRIVREENYGGSHG